MKQVIRYFVFIFVLCLFGSYAFPIRQVSCACSNEFCHCEAGPCPPGYTALCDCTGFVSPGGDIVNLDCRCGCNKETPPLIEPPARSDKMSIRPNENIAAFSCTKNSIYKQRTGSRILLTAPENPSWPPSIPSRCPPS